MPELVRAIAGSLPQGASVDEVLETAEELARFPGVELVEFGGPGRPARFTTRELLEVEREALELALAGRDAQAPRPDEKTLLRTLIQSRTLRNDQRHLVREASLSPDRVVCVVGVAGAGKTTALRALADAHRESDIAVLGAAPSARAADELAHAIGIRATTLHRLLFDAHREGRLPDRCVIVIDEAGMAETRVLAPLLRLIDQAEGKALLVGDPGQLPAVGAGGLYPALCDRLGAIELTGNRRQRDLSERQALTRLRAGDPEPYLAHAARRGRLQLADDPTVAKQRLLEDWWQVAQHDLDRTVMLAYRRADVRDLNDAARTLLLRAGRLGPHALALDQREFRVGDRVLCRQNDTRLGVRNGTRGTIIDLDETTLTVRTDGGSLRSLPVPYAAEHLDHAYALTGHAAQGATVDRAFILLLGEGALREWGYVACSRARTETRLYLADRVSEVETAHEDDRRSPPERAARALERSAAEPLALDQTKRRHDVNGRLLTRRQEELERQRDRAAKRLATVQRELKQLGWWSRGGRRFQLERNIAFHQTALRALDEKREELARTAPPRARQMPRGLGRDHEEFGRSLRPEPPARRALQREPPSLGLGL
ncbi:MAG: ATP-dependent DNA helicase [Gaiellaceae bacterium]